MLVVTVVVGAGPVSCGAEVRAPSVTEAIAAAFRQHPWAETVRVEAVASTRQQSGRTLAQPRAIRGVR